MPKRAYKNPIILGDSPFEVFDDGATSDRATIQRAMNFSERRSLRIPASVVSYYLDDDVLLPAGGVNLIVDPGARFSGPGRMPGDTINPAQLYISSFEDYTADFVGEAGKGYFKQSYRFECEPEFIGYGGAFYASAQNKETSPVVDCSAFLWVANTVLWLRPGLTGNGIGYEADANFDSLDNQGIGILSTGIGSKKGLAAYMSDRAAGVPWAVSYWGRNAEINFLADGQFAPIGAFGFVARNYNYNHAKYVPADDLNPSYGMVYISNAADDTVMSAWTKRGGLIIGPGGNEVTNVFSVTATLSVGTVTANATKEVTISVPGVLAGDMCFAVPNLHLAAGIVVGHAYCYTDGTVVIPLGNVTTSNVNADGGSSFWRATVVRQAV